MMTDERIQRIHAKAQAKVETNAQPKRVKAAAAGARSTHATPLGIDQRLVGYMTQTGRLYATPRQWRRATSKLRRNGSHSAPVER